MVTYDTHAHLDHLEDLESALNRAFQAGVKGIVAVSMDLESCKKSLKIKNQFSSPKIFLGMGVHPSEANLSELNECLDFVRENIKELTVVGEIGLDFWYKWVRKDQEKKDEQRKVFKEFLLLAQEFNLPAVIHSRGAWRECFETVRDLQIVKAEFHWYSGPTDVLKDILDAGYYISASPSVAYSPQSREAITYAPIEQTLIETDCPVFFNDKDKGIGFKSEPKDVFRTLEAYCELKNVKPDIALQHFNQNAKRFFGISLEGI
ncbi:MAG: TatD family hydrolase [Candidatus Omnitrophica bacterium]|nr:TatD family hydrolase [Candidatus Omnitrophota bacterium]